MEHFAQQNYYDSIVAKIVATGGRFLSQVQTTSEQFKHYVDAEAGRVTQLIFDVPEKALFVVLSHNEMYGFLGDKELSNHWSIQIDCEYLNHSKLYEMLGGTYDEPSVKIDEIHNTFDKIEGITGSGWQSRCENSLSFKSDISEDNEKVLVPENVVVAVASQVLAYQGNHDYLVNNFTELSPFWHPHYIFKEMDRGIPKRGVEDAVKTHFWIEFVKNGIKGVQEIVRNKIGKGH